MGAYHRSGFLPTRIDDTLHAIRVRLRYPASANRYFDNESHGRGAARSTSLSLPILCFHVRLFLGLIDIRFLDRLLLLGIGVVA